MILQGAYIPACWQRTGSRLPQHEKPREIPDRGERKAIPGRFPGRTRVAGDPTSRDNYQLKIRVLVLRQVGFAQETARDSQKNGWMGDRLCLGLARYCSAGRIECPISPASARDSQRGWYCSTSGIGPLPSSRLPQHEIPSKAGTAVPPGTARSLRGRSDPAVRFMARVAGLIPGQPGRPVSALFPAWHLRDRPAPFGDGAIRPSDSWQGSPDSSRDSRVGRDRHFSRHGTSGIGPLPSGTEPFGHPILWQGPFDSACLSTRFPARMVLQYLRDRPIPREPDLPQHRKFSRRRVAPWVFDRRLSTLLGESRPEHYLFRMTTR